MARDVRTHVGSGGDGEGSSPISGDNVHRLAPKHLRKQDFGRRLYSLMMAKGWHQSELARQSGIERSNISSYVRGLKMPDPHNVKRLAEALGVTEEALLPNQIEHAIDEDDAAFSMKASTADNNVVWLRVNRLVRMDTALKIGTLLNADDAADRK